jgi:hypothetical protein
LAARQPVSATANAIAIAEAIPIARMSVSLALQPA